MRSAYRARRRLSRDGIVSKDRDLSMPPCRKIASLRCLFSSVLHSRNLQEGLRGVAFMKNAARLLVGLLVVGSVVLLIGDSAAQSSATAEEIQLAVTARIDEQERVEFGIISSRRRHGRPGCCRRLVFCRLTKSRPRAPGATVPPSRCASRHLGAIRWPSGSLSVQRGPARSNSASSNETQAATGVNESCRLAASSH